MIALVPGARVWLACGATDMRRGMPGLALIVQEGLGRDPRAGDLFVFRGKRGSLLKILRHDGAGISLHARRLEKGRFIWPAPKDGAVAISAAQPASRLDGIDWRNPRQTWRPASAGYSSSRRRFFSRSLTQCGKLVCMTDAATGIEALRELYGQRSERKQRLLDQLELPLEGEPCRAIDEVDGPRFRHRDVPYWGAVEATIQGSHPWISLPPSASTLPSPYSRSTASTRKAPSW